MSLFFLDVRTMEAAKLASQIKNSVKTKVTADSVSSQNVHLQTLIKQGESIKFLHQQQENTTWKGGVCITLKRTQ